MMPTNTEVEQVYQFIWEYVTGCEALPTSRQIAAALSMPQEAVLRCVHLLRAQQRLCETTLKPTAYDAWWREHVRREQRWTFKPLVPLRRLQEKQLPLRLE